MSGPEALSLLRELAPRVSPEVSLPTNLLVSGLSRLSPQEFHAVSSLMRGLTGDTASGPAEARTVPVGIVRLLQHKLPELKLELTNDYKAVVGRSIFPVQAFAISTDEPPVRLFALILRRLVEEKGADPERLRGLAEMMLASQTSMTGSRTVVYFPHHTADL